MSPEQLIALNLPADLPRVLKAVQEEINAGRSPAPILRGLAVLNPLALIDVVIGPRAPDGAAMMQAALSTIATLESVGPPGALYRRHVRQAGPARLDVLHAAVTRHPDADWLIPLSRLAEGEQAGHTHLCAIADEDHFLERCRAHAAAGHRAGLVTAARELHRMEPLLALMDTEDLPTIAAGIIALMEVAPQAGIVERVAARWGPDLEPLLAATLPHLHQPAAEKLAEQLRRYTHWYPELDHALSEHLARLLP